MKSTVETLSPTRVRLAVEVPFDELKPSFDAAYKKIGAQVKVPGFRPGKVPGRILEQRFGRPAILEQVINDAIPKAYGEAIRDNEVRVLGQPEIEVTNIEDGAAVSFTAEVDVRPEITLPDTAALAVTVDDIVVPEDEIDEQVGLLRERFATLTGVERAAQDGDYVSIDLDATVDGEPVEGGSTTGLSHEVGSGGLLDGLDEALVGMSAGDSTTFQTELPAGDAEGATADVAVTVRSVKAKDLPELDDEFAQTASEFDTLDELRTDVRTRLERVKAMQQGGQARDRLVETLIEAVDVPLPESVVASEVEWRQHAIDHQLEQSGLTMADYLSAEARSEEELQAELRGNAEKAVASQLILETYADQHEIGVSNDDLMQHIVMQAQRYGVKPEEYAQQMSESGQISAVVADIRRNNALAVLLEATTVTDASGRPVDLAALRPKPETVPATPEADIDESDPEPDSADAGAVPAEPVR
ncbi:trigger factor [soil metagenome]